jgi:hypothetical protein
MDIGWHYIRAMATQPDPDHPFPPLPEPDPEPMPAPPPEAAKDAPKEVGGRGGLDPVRYGDWEKKGIAVDF